MSRKITAIEAIAVRERTSGPRCILDSINDHKPGDVGRYAGWGTEADAEAPVDKGEPSGPAMMPFLRHRASDRWWKVGIGFAYVPAIIAVITVEDWLRLSQSVMWISLGVFYLAFMGTIYLTWRSR
jgi:hypothetical protein